MKLRYWSDHVSFLLFVLFLTGIFLVFCFNTVLFAKDITFTWLPNNENITGYKLYYKIGADPTPPYDGTGITEGDSPITLDNVTTTSVTGLSSYDTYHFTLTAFNEEEESDFTQVITVNPEPVPVILDVKMIQ